MDNTMPLIRDWKMQHNQSLLLIFVRPSIASRISPLGTSFKFFAVVGTL